MPPKRPTSKRTREEKRTSRITTQSSHHSATTSEATPEVLNILDDPDFNASYKQRYKDEGFVPDGPHHVRCTTCQAAAVPVETRLETGHGGQRLITHLRTVAHTEAARQIATAMLSHAEVRKRSAKMAASTLIAVVWSERNGTGGTWLGSVRKHVSGLPTRVDYFAELCPECRTWHPAELRSDVGWDLPAAGVFYRDLRVLPHVRIERECGSDGGRPITKGRRRDPCGTARHSQHPQFDSSRSETIVAFRGHDVSESTAARGETTAEYRGHDVSESTDALGETTAEYRGHDVSESTDALGEMTAEYRGHDVSESTDALGETTAEYRGHDVSESTDLQTNATFRGHEVAETTTGALGEAEAVESSDADATSSDVSREAESSDVGSERATEQDDDTQDDDVLISVVGEHDDEVEPDAGIAASVRSAIRDIGVAWLWSAIPVGMVVDDSTIRF